MIIRRRRKGRRYLSDYGLGFREIIDVDYRAGWHIVIFLIQSALLMAPGFRGQGGHGLKCHGRHGYHDQVSIGVSHVTWNFRRQYSGF